MNSRPWFVSFTAIWKDAEGYDALQNICSTVLESVPFNHLPVKESCWHFTVLPLFRATMFPPDIPAEDFMLEFSKSLWESFSCEKIVLPSLSVEAYKIMAFDSGTCIQFSSMNNSLENMRDNLRTITSARIEKLISSNDGLISELLPTNRKNSGNESYGSIARSLTPESNSVRWQTMLDSVIPLKFPRIYLLVSDEYLSNPSAHDNTRRYVISLEPN